MAAKKTNKIVYFLIFAGVSSAFLVLLYLLIGNSVFSFSKKVEAELKARQATLQETQDLVRQLPNPQKASEELSQRTAELKEMGYNKKQVPKLLQLLGKKAVDGGMNVVSIRPREDIKPAGEVPQGVTKVYLEVVLQCEYRQLAEYMAALASMPYSFMMESFSMTKREKSPEEAASAGSIEAFLLVSTCLVTEQQ